jgi:hypothetical protein
LRRDREVARTNDLSATRHQILRIVSIEEPIDPRANRVYNAAIGLRPYCAFLINSTDRRKENESKPNDGPQATA